MSRPHRHIQAVVFDLDDTLFREGDYVRSGLAAVDRRLGGNGKYAGWMWRRFLAGRRGDMFDALGRRYRLGLSAAGIAELVEVYRRHAPAIRPCRGVVELLRALRRRGIRSAVLSDGFLPAQQLKLDALHLAELFDEVLFTESIGRQAWKPSPIGFEKLRRRMGAPHERCAYVADNPAKDFVAPNALGWLTIQWRRGGQVHADNPAPPGGRPRRIVRSGPELLRLVDKWGN
ncbi:MAG TPA: HAD family hydrolase [Phycisphaerae bacterium]|nr:HAD family hydrolase [Phycisphaerae bacterium]